MVEANKLNDNAVRLQTTVGIGPITANALVAEIEKADAFKNGRHLSAWIGLVPKQHTSGDKHNLQGISKRGNTYLRTLLIHGARSLLHYCSNKTDKLSVWAMELKARRGHNKACVAVANKLARIAWVILRRNEEYREFAA